MKVEKNDDYYLKKIINDLNFIIKHTHNLKMIDLETNELLLDSIMFRFIQISENAKKISQSFKNTKNNVEWSKITGFRNLIVHEYNNVDLTIVYNTIAVDVVKLKLALETFQL